MNPDTTPWGAVATCTLVGAGVAILAAAARGLALHGTLRLRVDTIAAAAASPLIAVLLLGTALALFAERGERRGHFTVASVLGALVTLLALFAAIERMIQRFGPSPSVEWMLRTGSALPVLATGMLAAIVSWLTYRHARILELHLIPPDEEP